jgi:NAD(P)-dependent dehydrogenase (short-subunit alcohol dehydrogenase family)
VAGADRAPVDGAAAQGTTSLRLDGRRALVTGASRGIGSAVAEAMAAAGADLVLSGRAAPDLEDLAARLADAHGVRTAVVPADLADAASVEALARDALDAFDGLDVLVNNAGISFPEPVTGLSVEHWDAVMAVNLRAPALLAARVGAAMVEAGRGGKIVNIASAAGLRALPEHYGYCTSKAGLVMATKVLALELGPHDIQANVVCPTVILTEMGQRVWGEAEKAAPMLGRIPAGHFGVPADVANAVLFLASSASDMVNGVELPVDGGYTVS